MYMNLSDFDVDIFLRMDDENIYIYYADFETIPEISSLMPLGSFEDERFQFIKLSMDKRLTIGTRFMLRDFYANENPITGETVIRVDYFMEQFGNIPEVTQFFEKWISQCEGTNTASWCCNNNTYSKVPEYCKSYVNEKCAIKVPITEFNDEELYNIIVMYFNGIYRTSPEYAQNFTPYTILTDVNFDTNYFSIIVDIKEFFLKEFTWFIQTSIGDLIFAGGYGTDIKKQIQTKNSIMRQRLTKEEITFFISYFNGIYNELAEIEYFNMVSEESSVGADRWIINIMVKIKSERLIFRLIK